MSRTTCDGLLSRVNANALRFVNCHCASECEWKLPKGVGAIDLLVELEPDTREEDQLLSCGRARMKGCHQRTTPSWARAG